MLNLTEIHIILFMSNLSEDKINFIKKANFIFDKLKEDNYGINT